MRRSPLPALPLLAAFVLAPPQATFAQDASLRLTSRPELQIGSVDGPAATRFQRIVGTVRLPDGRIVVADAGSGELRFFGPDGKPLLAAGGAGGGPGEFTRTFGGATGLAAVGRVGTDSVAAYDLMAGRITVFSPGGDHALDRAVGGPGGAASGLVRPVGWTGDGSFVGLITRRDAGEAPATGRHLDRPDEMLVTSRRGAAALDTGARFPGDARFMDISPAGEGGKLQVSISTPPFAASLAASAADGLVAVGPTDGRVIHLYDAGLDPVGTLHLDGRRLAVTDDRVSAWVDRQLSDAVDPSRRRVLRERYRGLPVPDSLPVFGDLVVDRAGRVWVEAYPDPEPDSATSWTVFDRTGRKLSRLRMPGRFRPLEIGAGYVLGVWKDDLDVEYVRLYRLVAGDADR